MTNNDSFIELFVEEKVSEMKIYVSPIAVDDHLNTGVRQRFLTGATKL